MFSVDLNIVAVVHAAALTERNNVKYTADLSAQLQQEKDLFQNSLFVGQEKKLIF